MRCVSHSDKLLEGYLLHQSSNLMSKHMTLLFKNGHPELENRLLARFDAASQKRELSTMAECAKILSQVAGFISLACYCLTMIMLDTLIQFSSRGTKP